MPPPHDPPNAHQPQQREADEERDEQPRRGHAGIGDMLCGTRLHLEQFLVEQCRGGDESGERAIGVQRLGVQKRPTDSVHPILH